MSQNKVEANAIPPLRTFEAWLQRGVTLVQSHRQAKWAIGDWLLEADQEDTDRLSAGIWSVFNHDLCVPPYDWLKTAAAHFGYTYDTFLQFKRVAAAFPPATRVASLSWHHHLAVAAIADASVRAEWLRLAGDAGWSSKDFQSKVSVTKYGLTMAEALKVSELSAALELGADKIQVLIVREFLLQCDLASFTNKYARGGSEGKPLAVGEGLNELDTVALDGAKK